MTLADLIPQTLPDWWPDWSGETCVIVASGPSAKDTPIDLARGKARVIAINNSWRLAPWADVLFACDLRWWDRYGVATADFEGLRLSTDANACRRYPFLGRVALDRSSDRMNFAILNRVGWGGNSGFQALNLAAQFGANRIVLVGYDMTTRHGAHWHGRHPNGMANPSEPNIARWRRALDGAAQSLVDAGVEVLNASPISMLTGYPRVRFVDAL